MSKSMSKLLLFLPGGISPMSKSMSNLELSFVESEKNYDDVEVESTYMDKYTDTSVKGLFKYGRRRRRSRRQENENPFLKSKSKSMSKSKS